MRRVYVSTYTIYIDIYVLYVHMYMTHWKIGCALLVYWDFHLAKSNLCRGELLRCYRLTSWAAAILERRRDESIIPAAVLERRRRDESIIPVGKSHFGMVKKEHSHFQPEVVWKIYETRIFKTKNNNRFTVYPVGNPNGGIWGSVPSGESLRTGMSLLETRVARRRSGLSHQTAEEAEAKSIPKDTILLVLMISLCCFNNTVFWLSFLLSFPHFASLLVTKTPNWLLQYLQEGWVPAAQSPTRFATSWRLGYLPFSSRSTTDGTLRWLSVWLNRPEICRRLFCWESFQVVPMMAHQKWDSVAAFSCSPTISPGWCCFGCWDRWHVFCKLFDPVVGEGTGTKRIGSKYPRLLQCQALCSRFSSDPPATKGTLQFGDGKPLAGGSGYSASADGFPLCLQFEIHHRLKPFLLLGRQRSSPYDAGLVQDCPQRWGLFLQRCGPFDLFRGGWKIIWDQTGLSSSFFP